MSNSNHPFKRKKNYLLLITAEIEPSVYFFDFFFFLNSLSDKFLFWSWVRGEIAEPRSVGQCPQHVSWLYFRERDLSCRPASCSQSHKAALSVGSQPHVPCCRTGTGSPPSTPKPSSWDWPGLPQKGYGSLRLEDWASNVLETPLEMPKL